MVGVMSSEALPRPDESSSAKPVRVADAAPLWGRSRPMVVGATVAVPWRRTGSPSPVTRGKAVVRTAVNALAGHVTLDVESIDSL